MARFKAGKSRLSPSMRRKLGCRVALPRKRVCPVEKLSHPTTLWPASSKDSVRLLPIKPAAPVIKIVCIVSVDGKGAGAVKRLRFCRWPSWLGHRIPQISRFGFGVGETQDAADVVALQRQEGNQFRDRHSRRDASQPPRVGEEDTQQDGGPGGEAKRNSEHAHALESAEGLPRHHETHSEQRIDGERGKIGRAL